MTIGESKYTTVAMRLVPKVQCAFRNCLQSIILIVTNKLGIYQPYETGRKHLFISKKRKKWKTLEKKN